MSYRRRPVGPVESLDLDVFAGAPAARWGDEFGLVETDFALGRRSRVSGPSQDLTTDPVGMTASAVDSEQRHIAAINGAVHVASKHVSTHQAVRCGSCTARRRTNPRSSRSSRESRAHLL